MIGTALLIVCVLRICVADSVYRFGTYSTSEAILAGLDLEMPGKTKWRGQTLMHAVLSQKVPEFILDERVRNVLNLINFAGRSGIPENAEEKTLNRPQDQALLRRAAAESVVLMKNDGNILPLDKKKPIAVIGPNARIAAYCGGGSASLDPYYVVTPYEGVSAKSQGEVRFSQGVYSHMELPLLGPSLRTGRDGETGYIFRAYNEPPENPNREMVDEVHMVASLGILVDYSNPKLKSATWYADMEGYFTPEEDGIYDFGVTVAGTGKLLVDDEVVVDNTKNQRRGPGFFGFGSLEERGSKELKAGKAYKVILQFGSSPTSSLNIPVFAFGPGAFRFGGCRRVSQEELITNAVQLAKESEQVVIFAGLTGDWEAEGHDRDHMDLPPGSDEMISRVLQANPRAVVVLQSGTPVTMPWASSAPALVQAWYGGNESGNGIADVLYGDVNPSGKLPLTFPVRLEDNPSYLNFRSERGRVLYGEDVYVGYRYYEKAKRAPLFPFGHGLSYTTFSRTDLTVEESSMPFPSVEAVETITARLTVKNTGSMAGAETMQLWITSPTTSAVNRPVRELKDFRKVYLQAGQEQRVEVGVEKQRATSWWDEQRDAWISEEGEYGVEVTGTGEGVLRGAFRVEKTKFWKGL